MQWQSAPPRSTAPRQGPCIPSQPSRSFRGAGRPATPTPVGFGNDGARNLCRQTWELATGFSHRKDPTLNKTLDAIGFLVEAAPKDARRLLAQVASQVHSVLDYTDGSGTRHVLTVADALLAKLAPAALVAKYEDHVDTGQWSQAENSLSAYVKQGAKAGWPLDALMRTGLHPHVGDVLQSLAKEGVAGAAERLQVLNAHGGWDSGVRIARNTRAPTRMESPSMVRSRPSRPSS